MIGTVWESFLVQWGASHGFLDADPALQVQFKGIGGSQHRRLPLPALAYSATASQSRANCPGSPQEARTPLGSALGPYIIK